LIINLILQRLALGVLTLFVVSLVIFTSVEMLPGDFAQAILGQSATAETLQAYRDELGLERPAVSRYLEWLGNAVQGDLGASLANGKPISELIGARLGNTLFLAGMTAAIAIPFAVSLGILAALFRNSWFDRSISVSTLTSISFPEFFVAYVLILWFAIKLQWFPALANIASDSPFETRVFNSILPSLTLTLVVTAHMMRMTRAAILNVMQSAYIETAELKGLSGLQIIWRHAFPNAIAPIVNVVMLNLAYLVVGVVVVEVVFVYPGMGQYLVDHVSKRDIPVVQACGLIFAAVYIGLNLIADLVSILANPRLRHPK